MKTLSTNTIIQTTPNEVWRTFSKFYAFELWNPFISNIEGDVALGEKLKVTLYPSMRRISERIDENRAKSDQDSPPIDFSDSAPLNKSSRFKVRVTQLEEGRYLRWERRSFLLGTYIHEFSFQPQGTEQTRFENSIQMGGFLVNMGWDQYIKHLYQGGLEEMNLGLKMAVESDDLYIDDELTTERF